MTLLVTWLWQGLIIAWITAAAVRAMPRLNAATRHVVWWLALAAVLALPVAHGLAAITTGAPSAPDLTLLDAAGVRMLPAIPGGVMACAAAMWAMTAAVGVRRIARSCRAVGRLKRVSSPFDRSREARLPLWVAARGGGHRSAELRTSDCPTGACALGLGRPVILVSRSLANVLSDASLDEIVMHEQAHLDRYDDWSQLLLAVVGSLAGLHPAVRFLTRRLEVDREAACDDRVVSRTGATRRYASSLLRVAAVSTPGAGGIEVAGSVPTATTTPSALRVRVERLLEPRRDRGARLAGVTSLVSVTVLALAVGISTQVAPVVVFLETAAVNVPAGAVVLAIEVPRALESAPRTNVTAAAAGLKRPLHLTPTRVNRPTRSELTEVPTDPFVATRLEAPPTAPPTAPLDSRNTVPGASAALALRLPSLASAIVPPLTDATGPWQAVRTSTASASGDVARAAAANGARAWSTGVSIGRFFTRASKAGANIF